jgi:hypothetical protein
MVIDTGQLVNDTMKVCTRCLIPKDLACFSPNRRMATGRQSRCKVCCAAVLITQRWERRVATITTYGGACLCCGSSYLPFLTLDHISGGGSEHRHRLGSGSRIYRWAELRGYPQSLRVLCFSCNDALGSLRSTNIAQLRHAIMLWDQFRTIAVADDFIEYAGVPCRSCIKCRSSKPVAAFPRRHGSPHGNICKPCHSRRQQIKRIARLETLGGACACCGEDFPHFLHVDHVHGRQHLDLRVLCSSCNNGIWRHGGMVDALRTDMLSNEWRPRGN